MVPSTLDIVPSTLDMEPSTLDPRQKPRLKKTQGHEEEGKIER